MENQLQQLSFVDKLFKKSERESVDKWANHASAFEIRDFNNLMQMLSSLIKAEDSSTTSSRSPSRGRILSGRVKSKPELQGKKSTQTQILDLETGTVKAEIQRPMTPKAPIPARNASNSLDNRPHSAPTFASTLYKTSNAYADYSLTAKKVSDNGNFIVKFYCSSFVEDLMVPKLREWYSLAGKKDQELLKDVFGRLIRSQKSTSYRDSHRSPPEEVLKNAFEGRKNFTSSSKPGKLFNEADSETRLKQLEIIHQHQLEKIRTQQVMLDGNKVSVANLKEVNHQEVLLERNSTELPGYASTDGRFAREKMMEGIFTSSIRLGMYPKDEQFKSFYASQYQQSNVASKRAEEYKIECASGQFHHKTKPY